MNFINQQNKDSLNFFTNLFDFSIFYIISILFFSFFCLAFFRYSFLKLLLFIELLFLFLGLLFLFYSFYYDSVEGSLFFLYLLGISAAETALGLSMFILLTKQSEFSSN